MPAPKNNLTEQKPRMSLAPLDIIMKYDIPAYEEGVLKYERESWREGFETSVMIDAALRHIIKFYYFGEDYDSETIGGIKKHHLGAARFCLSSIIHSLENYPELDDRIAVNKNEATSDPVFKDTIASIVSRSTKKYINKIISWAGENN